jgi:hypothetical protein
MYKSVVNDTFEKLWDDAYWVASGFAFSPDNQAAIAFVFQNQEPALEVFRQWQSKLGRIDVDELLRISIIEGDIPGQAPGYTIHLTSNVDAILKNTDVSKMEDDEQLQIMMMSKYQRLQPQEQGLDRFKTTFAQRKEYIILPAFYIESNVHPHFELSILKKEIHFRKVEDISQKDIDSLVFNRYEK